MASNTLTSNSVSSTYSQLLHIGTGTATAATVRTGDGTATVLEFVAGGIKSNGTIEATGTLKTNGITLAREGSTARTLTLPDWSGKVPVQQEVVKSSDQSNSSITAEAVIGLSLALEAGSIYEFEGILLAKAIVATTGVQLQLTGDAANTDYVVYDIDHPTTNTLLTSNTRRQYFTAFASNMLNLDAPTANALFPVFIRGILKTGAAGYDLGLSFNSEIATSAVTIAAGSMLRARKIA